MIKKNFIIIATTLAVLGVMQLSAQGNKEPEPKPVLKISEKLPLADGVIKADEYPVKLELNKMTVYLSRTEKGLYFAITAKTKGWIAIGFDAVKMHNARMFLGYVKGKDTFIREDKGSGRSHNKRDTALLKAYALAESADGVMIFEGELAASEFITKDQKALELITAFGNSDNFTGIHAARDSYAVPLN